MLHLDLDTMTIKYKKEKILDLKIKNIKRFLLIKVKGFCKKIKIKAIKVNILILKIKKKINSLCLKFQEISY